MMDSTKIMSTTYISQGGNQNSLIKHKQPKMFAIRTFPDAFGVFSENIYQDVEEEEDPSSESSGELEKGRTLHIENDVLSFDAAASREIFDSDVLTSETEGKNVTLEEEESIDRAVGVQDDAIYLKKIENSYNFDLHGKKNFLLTYDKNEAELPHSSRKFSQRRNENSEVIEKMEGMKLNVDRAKSSRDFSRCKILPPRRKVSCIRSFPPQCGIDSTNLMKDKEKTQVTILYKSKPLKISLIKRKPVETVKAKYPEIMLKGREEKANGKGKDKIQIASVQNRDWSIREEFKKKTRDSPHKSSKIPEKKCGSIMKNQTFSHCGSGNPQRPVIVLGLKAADNCPWRKSRFIKRRR